MASILLCHLAAYWQCPAAIGQFFGIGVSIFFLLSGYLYGQKEIAHWGRWAQRRISTLLLPMWIWVLFCAALAWWSGRPVNGHDLLLYACNSQGLSYIGGVLGEWPLFRDHGSFPGCGPLWFLSVLMLCYLLLPLMQRWRRSSLMQQPRACALFIVVLFLLSVLAGFGEMRLGYFLLFATGYFVRPTESGITARSLIGWSALAFVGILIRVLGRSCCDGSTLYDFVLVGISSYLLGLGLFALLRAVGQRGAPLLRCLPLRWLDGLSYEIYLTHGLFVMGAGFYSVSKSFPHQLLPGTLIFAAATIVSALLLQQCSRACRHILCQLSAERSPGSER